MTAAADAAAVRPVDPLLYVAGIPAAEERVGE